MNAVDALRLTGVTRSKNNPVADYAEWLACRALGLRLASKSTKGHDALDRQGVRYEIKARRVTTDNSSRQLSAIRGIDEQHFDYLIGIVFDAEFGVLRACKIPWAQVNTLSKHNAHTNSSLLILKDKVWDVEGVEDLTKQMKGVLRVGDRSP